MVIAELETILNFWDFISQGTLALVEFYHNKWAPCTKFDSILYNLAQDFADRITVAKVNVENVNVVKYTFIFTSMQ